MFHKNDRVKILDYEAVPEELKSRAVARLCGRGATVLRALCDEFGEALYVLQIDDCDAVSSVLWPESAITEEPKENFSFNLTFNPQQMVCEAFMYSGDTELGYAYGRVIGDTKEAVVQAASYAVKKLWLKIEPMAFDEVRR